MPKESNSADQELLILCDNLLDIIHIRNVGINYDLLCKYEEMGLKCKSLIIFWGHPS